MKNWIFLFLSSLLITGCAKQLEDFVRGGKTLINPETPTVSSKNPIALKASAGANLVEGSNAKVRFAISTSQKPVAGTQLKGKISFHQNRPE